MSLTETCFYSRLYGSSSKLSTSATRKTTTTKKPTTTTKLPPLFDGILQTPILEGINASKLTLSETN